MTDSVLKMDIDKKYGPLSYEEALKWARWYEERERCQTIQYYDGQGRKGYLQVTSVGIINKHYI